MLKRSTGLIEPMFVFLAIFLTAGCRSHSNPPAVRQGAGTPNNGASLIAKVGLADQIETFATDQDKLGEAAWKKLQAYPRQELIDRLVAMRDSGDQEEFVKGNVAFVLCMLDHDYGGNREIIVSIFKGSLEGAEDCEGPLDRLIARGDIGLLQVLFAAVPGSVSGLSETLAITFAKQIKDNTEAFLTELKTQPISIRKKVYEFIDEAASDQDKMIVNSRLKSILANSPLAGPAKEAFTYLPLKNTD